MRGARQKASCQQFSVRSYGSSPVCAAILHLLGWSVSCLMPLLFPLSIWVDWTRVSHCSVSGLLVLHLWAFCQGMELFWSLPRKMIAVRSPTHALDLLFFSWYDIVAISKKHRFLRKIAMQFLKKKKKRKSWLCWKLAFGWRLHLSLCMWYGL